MIFNNVIRLESTTSTMDVAVDLLRHEGTAVAHGTAILADSQTHGRGRHGRRWHSVRSGDLLVSYVLSPRSAIVGTMPILAGLAAAEAVDALTGVESQIKWPNDVLVGGKKVCGVIAESVSQGRETAVVLGIGMNLAFEPTETLDIRVPADNLSRIADRRISRDEAFRELTARVEVLYEAVDSGGSIIEEWKQRLSTIGHPVAVESVKTRAGTDGDAVRGIAVDVDELGRLLIRTEGGHLEAVAAGEVTMLGVA